MRFWPLALTLALCLASGCARPADSPLALMALAPKQTAGVLAWAPDGRQLLAAVDDPPYGGAIPSMPA
jgi:hypothetical protein